MQLISTGVRERRGFTLVELLVVIGIIGVLVALTAAAVIPLAGKGPAMQNINDIRQLESALHTFNADFKTYPPSRIFLSNNFSEYGTNPLGPESLSYLQRIWPRIDWSKGVDWGNVLNPGKVSVILEGDQCLVFFLGGMQLNGGCWGFSTDPYNPTALPKPIQPPEVRKGPYFTFDNNRLKGPVGPRPAPFSQNAYVYMDVYGAMPYAYFSTPKGPNRYNLDVLVQTVPVPGDCPSLVVSPYMKNPNPPIQYYNPNTFQIISAGKDMVFGAMTIVAPGNPAQGPGADDFSNFASGALGTGL